MTQTLSINGVTVRVHRPDELAEQERERIYDEIKAAMLAFAGKYNAKEEEQKQ